MTEINSNHEQGHQKTHTIIVNGRQMTVNQERLSYADVVKLAFPDDQPNPDVLYTVAFANPHGKDGTLVAGQDVEAKERMSFNVSKTNRS